MAIGVNLAVLLATAATFLYVAGWVPNKRLSDLVWLDSASPQELRETAQRRLLAPYSHPHDAFVILIDYGDAESIPYLLWGLRWLPDTPKGGVMPCTKAHCLEALRRITGHDAGLNYSDWAEWWASTGSKLPPTAFPVDQHPPEPSDR